MSLLTPSQPRVQRATTAMLLAMLLLMQLLFAMPGFTGLSLAHRNRLCMPPRVCAMVLIVMLQRM